MIKILVLCSVALFAIFSARCQTSPTRIDSTYQSRDNRSVTNNNSTKPPETNSTEMNTETMNRNAVSNSEMKSNANTKPLSSNLTNKK